MYSVEFMSGESRNIIRDAKLVGVDYMLVNVIDRDGYKVELYAERDTSEIWDYENECYKEGYDEYSFYDELKEDIIEQAMEIGVNADELKFW